MNKKVLKTMIALVCVFLIGIYVLKIFLPEQFVLVIENKALITIGNFISARPWLDEICAIITSFITYALYLCAVTHKWKLTLKEFIGICVSIAVTHIVYCFDVVLSSSIATVAMLILPALSKATLKDTTIVFTVHYLAQTLSTTIRGLPALLTNVNFITFLFLGVEGYFWLLLFYLYYNYKEDNSNG